MALVHPCYRLGDSDLNWLENHTRHMRQDLVDMFEGKKYRTVLFMQFEHCLSSVVPYGNNKKSYSL